MHREEAMEKLLAIQEKMNKPNPPGEMSYEEPDGHVDADDVLCEFLVALGYSDIVEAYNAISKWYE